MYCWLIQILKIVGVKVISLQRKKLPCGNCKNGTCMQPSIQELAMPDETAYNRYLEAVEDYLVVYTDL